MAVETQHEMICPHIQRTGKELRKVKIVNINTWWTKSGRSYGEMHEIPKKHESKINSFRNRIININ